MLRFIHILFSITLVASTLSLARAQSDAGEMGFSQLQGVINGFIERGEIARADPYLTELLARFAHAEDVSLEMPKFFAAQAKLALYGETGERSYLKAAEKQFKEFREEFPQSDQMITVLLTMGALNAEMGQLDEAGETLALLLRPPYERQLTFAQRTSILYDLTRIYYQGSKFEEGQRYFTLLLNESSDPLQKALAAAALFEAHMQATRVEEALALIPALATDTEVRYRPRLNVAFFRASDILANSARYADASLVLGLALTTPEMQEYFVATRANLQSQLQWLEGLGSSNPRIEELKGEIARIDANLEQMKELPSLEAELLVRKARNFVQTGRAYEAFWLFYRLMQENPKDDQIEFFTYATFANAQELQKTDTAIEVGERYLKQFPSGQYASDIELSLAFLFRDNEQWEDFERLALDYLNRYPNQDNGEMVLLSYARHLMENKEYERIETELSDLLRRHPRALYADGTFYWRGMAHLQQRNYDVALELFEKLNKDYPSSLYRPESMFRMGVILFAQEKFTESRAMLLDYQERYPDDPNLDQSFYFLAQVAKLAGDLPTATQYYKDGIAVSKSQEMQDVFHFELADLLMNSEKNEEAIALLEAYLTKFAEKGDVPTAYLMIGRAAEAERRPAQMLEVYRKAIAETIELPENPGMEEILMDYGNKVRSNRELFGMTLAFFDSLEQNPQFLNKIVTDRGALFEFFYENPGVDQTLYQRFRREPELGVALLENPAPLQALKAAYREQMDALEAEDAVGFLKAELAKARERGDFIGEVRLNMGLAQLGAAEPLSREITGEDMASLSPLTLLYVGEHLKGENNLELARRSWEEILNRFPVNDAAIKANQALAADAEASGDNERALIFYKTISDQFGHSQEAPEAVLSEGRVLTKLGRYEEARNRYSYVLAVPSWRGELYARAIYGSGKSYQAEELLPEAHGFMERVFVAYPQYGQWAGLAYLDDARILLEMGKPEDARKTLQEALTVGARTIPADTLDEIRNLIGTIP